MSAEKPYLLNFFTRGQTVALASTVLVYLAAAGGVFYFVSEDTLESALSLPLTIISALLGLSLLNYAIRSWRWIVMGQHLRMQVPAMSNALYYVAGFSMTSTPGKAGEAVRLWFLKSKHSVPYTRSIPLMFADRIIDMWAVVLLSAITATGFADYHWQAIVAIFVVIATSLPILFPRTFDPILRFLYALAPARGRLIVRGRRILIAMQELRSFRVYGFTLVPSILGWIAEGAALYVLLAHFNASVSLMEAVFVFSASIIVGALSMLPGGLGTTEAAMVILLRSLGVEIDVALAVTAIIRVTTFWFAVALGILAIPVALNISSRGPTVPSTQG